MTPTKALSTIFAPENFLYVLLVFVPVTIVLEYVLHASPTYIFLASALSIIPLAGLMGKATEHLAQKLGEGIGGLLNATFGNAAELIIAIMALRAGLYDLVKASITGSIIGNVLLVLGLSMVVGGIRHKSQSFNRTAASLASTLLALSAIGLVVPAIFHVIARNRMPDIERELSFEIAIVLIITYGLSLFFTLKTHAHLYVGRLGKAEEQAVGVRRWSAAKSAAVLLVATGFLAWMSEFLMDAVQVAAKQVGFSEVFVGVILVAIVGNAAEHSTALLMALRNKMDLAIKIAVGSSLQIALFVAPVLLFLSYLIGPTPMDLLFTTFEVVSVALTVGIMALIAQDGESNWMEGVQLLAVYIILGIAFFFLPV